MKKLGIWMIIMMLLTQGASIPALAACPETEAAFDGYLLKLSEGAPVPYSAELEFVTEGIYRVQDEELAEEFVAYGLAEYAEPNYVVTLFDVEESEDPEVTLPWAYTMMGADAAAEQGLDGEGIRIAIIDSGLQADNSNLSNIRLDEGYDYLNETTVMTDTQGHGTYVAQMIAGDGDDGMMQGIAPAATLVPLRCFGEKTTSISVLIRAIADAADPEKYDCDIINMSWGTTGKSALMEETLQSAYDAGVVLVAAAGNVNSTTPQGTVCYPAALPTVIGVGAVDREYTVASFSQQTAAVDVCAPGASILACNLAGSSAAINGTSFAAPTVSGVAALLLEGTEKMPPAFLQTLLRRTVVDLGVEGRDDAYGYGFVDCNVLWSKEAWLIDRDADGNVLGWLPAEREKNVLFAAYNGAGRMNAFASKLLAEEESFVCLRPKNTTGQGKVMILTAEMQPWTAAISLS